MGWLLPVLEFLPQLPGIISAVKHAFDHAPTEALTAEQLDIHQKVKGLVDVCHGAVCK